MQVNQNESMKEDDTDFKETFKPTRIPILSTEQVEEINYPKKTSVNE